MFLVFCLFVVVVVNVCQTTFFISCEPFILFFPAFTELFGSAGDVGVLSSADVRIFFNYHRDNTNQQDFEHLEPVIEFYNEDLDVAVLQLQERLSRTLPAPLGNQLRDVNQSATLHLIGHSNWWFKSVNLCCERCPPNHPDVVKLINPGALSPDRPLFKSTYLPGASGSPGFDEHGALVLMLTDGLDNGKEIVFCKGVSMKAVYNILSIEKPDLLHKFGWLRLL